MIILPLFAQSSNKCFLIQIHRSNIIQFRLYASKNVAKINEDHIVTKSFY